MQPRSGSETSKSKRTAEGHLEAELKRERFYRTLAGVYLRQALEAFRAAGSSDQLYSSRSARRVMAWRRAEPEMRAGILGGEALHRRTEMCRNATLFTALACEAYVNEYLAIALDSAEADALDRLPTPDKLIIGTRLAGGPVFSRGSGAGQKVVELFSVRNKLVHPRPGIGRYAVGAEAPRRDDLFNPATVVRYIVAVGEVAARLIDAGFAGRVHDSPASEIVSGKHYLRALARNMERRVPAAVRP